MAPANERWCPAPAKTAVALLAHYCLVQALRHKHRSRATPRCPGGGRLGCPDFSDWRKTHGLLARLHCRSDLSQLLRHIFARAHCHARTARQRVHRGRDFLRVVWLPAPASPAGLVRRLLDLLGLRLPHQRFTRPCLSGGSFSFAVDILSRSATAISRAFAMGISGALSCNRCPLAYLGETAFPRLFSSFTQLGMGRSSARAFR